MISSDKDIIAEALSSDISEIGKWSRFVAPDENSVNSIVVNSPAKYINPQEDLVIEAEIIGKNKPENVFVYPDYVSFWNEKNNLIPMKNTEGNTYRALVPKEQLGWNDSFNYNIVVRENGKYTTWPENTEGTPLDWDFTVKDYYTSNKLNNQQPIILLSPVLKDPNIEVAMIPEAWDFRFVPEMNSPLASNAYSLKSEPKNEGKLIVRRYVGDELYKAPFINNKEYLVVKARPASSLEGATIGLTGKNGATYSAPLAKEFIKGDISKMHKDNPQGIEFHVPLSAFSQTETNIVPAVYPSFLPREINTRPLPFSKEEIDFLERVIPTFKGQEIETAIEGIWLQ